MQHLVSSWHPSPLAVHSLMMPEAFFFYFSVQEIATKVKKDDCRLWVHIITPMPPPAMFQVLTLMMTQAGLYGFYVATLIHCLRWLVYTNDGWKLRDRIDNKPILITTIVIFLLSTVNLVLTLPIELYTLGDFGDPDSDSNRLRLTVVTPVISVCKCRGRHLEQKND
jgi:hypothetical protein